MGSRIINELHTPFDEPAMDAPPDRGELAGTRGGREAPSPVGGVGLVSSPFGDTNVAGVISESEDPNSLSGLSGRVDGVDAGEGDPGPGGTVDLPVLTDESKGRTLA